MTKTRFRILAVLWSFYIMAGAVLRGHKVGMRLQTVGFTHIAVHFAVFAFLGLLLMLSFEAQSARLLAVLFGIGLGLSTELYEHMAFGSVMEYADVFVDALGVLAGGTLRFLKRASMI